MGILDWVFPKKCIECGKEGEYVCADCEVGMWEEEQICPSCTRLSRYGRRHKYCHKDADLEGLGCFLAYEGLVKKLITEAKYKYQFDTLHKLVEICLKIYPREEYYFLNKFIEEKPIAIPVPLYKTREKARGFNQAEVIANLLAKKWKLTVGSRELLRIKDTGRQVGRERKERLAAMAGAFGINPKFQGNNSLFNSPSLNKEGANQKNVILVDDVWTTGATMRECAKVLKKSGVNQIWGLVLAR